MTPSCPLHFICRHPSPETRGRNEDGVDKSTEIDMLHQSSILNAIPLRQHPDCLIPDA